MQHTYYTDKQKRIMDSISDAELAYTDPESLKRMSTINQTLKAHLIRNFSPFNPDIQDLLLMSNEVVFEEFLSGKGYSNDQIQRYALKGWADYTADVINKVKANIRAYKDWKKSREGYTISSSMSSSGKQYLTRAEDEALRNAQLKEWQGRQNAERAAENKRKANNEQRESTRAAYRERERVAMEEAERVHRENLEKRKAAEKAVYNQSVMGRLGTAWKTVRNTVGPYLPGCKRGDPTCSTVNLTENAAPLNLLPTIPSNYKPRRKRSNAGLPTEGGRRRNSTCKSKSKTCKNNKNRKNNRKH